MRKILVLILFVFSAVLAEAQYTNINRISKILQSAKRSGTYVLRFDSTGNGTGNGYYDLISKNAVQKKIDSLVALIGIVPTLEQVISSNSDLNNPTTITFFDNFELTSDQTVPAHTILNMNAQGTIVTTRKAGGAESSFEIKADSIVAKPNSGIISIDTIQHEELGDDVMVTWNPGKKRLSYRAVTSSGGDMLKSENLSGLTNYTTARLNMGLAINTDVQAYDPDLAAIAALSPSNDDILQRKSGAWTNRTMAQLKTDLALTKSDVGLSNVDNTSDATKNSATATITNKRITKRSATTASTASLTIAGDDVDIYTVTALAANITINAPSGTPTLGQTLIIRIKDNGTGRTITFDAAFRAIGITLPTTTVANKTMYIGCIWNSTDSKWDVVSVNEEA